MKITMRPKYDLNKIRYATDAPTFEKAVVLYESGGVRDFKDNDMSGFMARVRGSGGNNYDVFVSARRYDEGDCSCYLGQNDTLCKHIVATAIYAVKNGKPLTDEDTKQVSRLTCSGKLGVLNKTELSDIKKSISSAIKYIKPYNGPSRTWFTYQNSLSEGCNRLSKIASDLPVSKQTVELLVDMLLRLDHKLCHGGVDDSDGTVGGFIEEVVEMLKEYARMDSGCIEAFGELKDRETCFDWEESLVTIINDNKKAV